MKIRSRWMFCLAVSVSMAVFLCFVHNSHGAILVTEWSIGEDFLELGVAGTLVGPAPAFNQSFLFIASEDPLDDYVRGSGWFSHNDITSIENITAGTRSRSVGFGTSFTSPAPERYDTISINFSGVIGPDLNVGDELTGTLRVRFLAGRVNLEEFSNPKLYWGRSAARTSASSGTFQAFIFVPEPTTTALALTPCLFFVGRRRI